MRMYQCYLRIALRARSASGLLDALGLGYDLPVGPLRGSYFSAARFLPSRFSSLRRSERTETLARIVFGAGFPLILLLKHCRFTSSTTAATSGLSAVR